ncbi:MAG: hypothetical protein H0W90_06655 [Actinobacteria bacterium]|nr:hypothetical protein [Actinomycetota bacterium]
MILRVGYMDLATTDRRVRRMKRENETRSTMRRFGSATSLIEIVALQLRKSTVTELVLRSEKRGLVQRQLEPDARGAIAVVLTPEGERCLAEVLAELGSERPRLVGILSKSSLR